MLYQTSQQNGGGSAVVHALGQTWFFTKGALRALRLFGVGTDLPVKAVVIELTTFDGLDDGIHEVNFSEIPLRLYVEGSNVVVEDPFNPKDE